METTTLDPRGEKPSDSNPPLTTVVRDEEPFTPVHQPVTPVPPAPLGEAARQSQAEQQASPLEYNIYTPSTSPPRPNTSIAPRHVIDFDWTHPDPLRPPHLRHFRYKRYLLDLIDDRVVRHHARFGINHAHEDNYRKKAYLIALSDASFRDKFCHCSIPNARNPAGTCGIRKFCPYCNHRLREKAQMMYVPAFSRGQWFSCTLSFKGVVSLDDEAGVSLDLYWNACNAVIRVLVSEGYISGAYWSEELSVRTLYPTLSVLPHAHAVLYCAPGATLDLDAIREELIDMMLCALEIIVADDEGLADIAQSLIFQPSIKLEPLATQRDLLFATGYVTKTIKLLDVYETGLDSVGRSEKWKINGQLNHFFDALDCELLEETQTGRPWNRRQLFRSGTLLPQNSGFVGTPKAERTTRADQQRLRCLFADLKRQPSNWSGDAEDPFAFEGIVLDDPSALDLNDDNDLEDEAD